MTLRHILGVDHMVFAVRDLDAAAKDWEGLGFTLSPRGTHSPQMGSGNYTIMFGDDYMELLGILAPTPHNEPVRRWLETREGIERCAFTTDDAAAGVAEVQRRGVAATGPIAFGRPVPMPDGSMSEARFEVFHWPVTLRPGGMRIFACQHFTRDAVWIPELQSHANGATGIARVEVLARDPKAAAGEMAGLIDSTVSTAADGAVAVPTGRGRAEIVFLDRDRLAARHPGISLDGLPEEGAAALVLTTRSLEKAAQALGTAPGATVAVPASRATGAILRFVAED
ncbi:VOC family protein [Roseococcus pinisoli]|uniref:VOC family protein n=1 Tax=Roseococcus pinisoli TaxID=2835040 RepID=A0ABS5QCZ2_9PROT|nr:VOC family protein [Roseococcus pinisoli]MBS7811557.1 VOC family protein [Roseococcus pinisoli]